MEAVRSQKERNTGTVKIVTSIAIYVFCQFQAREQISPYLLDFRSPAACSLSVWMQGETNTCPFRESITGCHTLASHINGLSHPDSEFISWYIDYTNINLLLVLTLNFFCMNMIEGKATFSDYIRLEKMQQVHTCREVLWLLTYVLCLLVPLNT
jgi:hypothetical protein